MTNNRAIQKGVRFRNRRRVVFVLHGVGVRVCGWGAFIASGVTVRFNGHVRRSGSTVRYSSTGADDNVTVSVCCLYIQNNARTAAPATMAMPHSTSTTKTTNLKRPFSVSTTVSIPPTHEHFQDSAPSPVDRFLTRQTKNPFYSSDDDDVNIAKSPTSPKSPKYSPSPSEYDPIDDKQNLFEGFLGKTDDSEEDSEEDDSALELKWVKYVANFMLHDIKKDKQMIPEEVMRAFESLLEMLDHNGECCRVRHKFEEFWDAFLCYLDVETKYNISKMDENKELKEDIEKYFNIIAIRYDDEKRCEKLGIFLRSFVALNDEGEKIEFSEENLLNHFRLDKKMYGDVRENHVKKLFKKLSKVINNSLSLASPPSSAREKHVKKRLKKLSKVRNG